MAVTSQRSVAITFAGDFSANAGLDAAENTASPAKIDIVTLAAGANTITPPTNAKAVTIVFPVGNSIVTALALVGGVIVFAPAANVTISILAGLAVFSAASNPAFAEKSPANVIATLRCDVTAILLSP